MTMTLTPEEHEVAQQQFVRRVAARLGVPGAATDEVDALLHRIEERDPAVFGRLEEFRGAYRAWFDAIYEFRTAEASRDVDGLRARVIGQRDVRDETRRRLIDYLDWQYPFSARGAPGSDLMVLAGIDK